MLQYLINYNAPEYLSLLRYLFYLALPFLVQRQVDNFQQQDYVNNFNQINYEDVEIHDFVIVGAGSAGAVLANRLSAPPNKYSVLLLEAGNDPAWVTFYPGYDIFASNNPGLDWKYLSQPQRDCCLSCIGKRLGAWRGKGLGGSSLINFLIYNRGNPGVFDNWADFTGDHSWKYEFLLPYFKKSENYTGNYPNPLIHGCGGELGVEKIISTPGASYFLQAIRDFNVTEQDANANQTNAFMLTDQTSKFGTRESTYMSFLLPILNRKNLFINRNSYVTKILYDPLIATRVIGVEYVRFNKTKRALATREVILSAGAFNSPKILLASGIGPKGDLMELGIPSVRDLPVGKKLQDHPATLFTVVFNTTNTSRLFERDVVPDVITNALYPVRYTQGVFQGNNLIGLGYYSTKYNDDISWPDIEANFFYLGLSHLTPGMMEHLFNIDRLQFAKMQDLYEGRDGNMVLVSLTRPSSVGYVALNGTNPMNNPIIQPNLYTDLDDMDIKRMVQGLKHFIEFYEKSAAWRAIGAQLLPMPWPSCKHHLFRSSEYYECYIRHVTFTQWHYSGTCRMGPITDPTTVVDSRLRILGFSNLRVVDASVMPRITNGNTNAAVIMIAEKAADMIIKDNRGITVIPGSQEPCPIRLREHDEL